MAGRVFSINISKAKGRPKDRVDSCIVVDGLGIEGDAHAGQGERQVSLLSLEAIKTLKEEVGPAGVELRPGMFAENITTAGLDLSGLKPGDKLNIGESVVLKITAIGKACHSGCSVTQAIGRCIMPKQGIFASVEKGGGISVSDRIRVAA